MIFLAVVLRVSTLVPETLGAKTLSSKRMITLIGGCTVVLFTSFYSAGLTMILASRPNLPFDSVFEAISQPDNWNLMVMYGTRNALRQLQGLSPIEEFQGEVGQWHFDDSFNVKLRRFAEEPQVHVVSFGNSFRWMLEQRPELAAKMDVVEFCKQERGISMGVLFPRSSPFFPAVNAVLKKMRENGGLKRYASIWYGGRSILRADSGASQVKSDGLSFWEVGKDIWLKYEMLVMLLRLYRWGMLSRQC